LGKLVKIPTATAIIIMKF